MLHGHPLAMRVVLSKLETTAPALLTATLKSNSAQLDGDEQWDQVQATIRLVVDAMRPELQPLLDLVGMHEAYVDGDYLEAMAGQLGPENTRERVDEALAALATVGLVRELGQSVYEMHPALTGFLRERSPAEPCARAFVGVIGALADHYAPKELHEQRAVFGYHGANFRFALSEAERLGSEEGVSALTQALASYAQRTRDYSQAERLYEQLANLYQSGGNAKGEAAAYHQLGRVAEERRDFDAAEKWYLKSLAIFEKQGDEHDAASSYHQLGRVAEKRRDFDAAEKWHLKSLAIEEKQGNEHGAATSYHQLGTVAEERRDFGAAEKWYLKSLAIKEKQGDEHGAASSYHQLGIVAQERRDFDAAEKWYLKSLAIEEKQGNEHGAAVTLAQLGVMARERGHRIDSGRWFLRAFLAFSKSDPHNAQRVASDFFATWRTAPGDDKSKLRAIWEEADLPWPEDAQADAGDAPG